MKKTLCLFILFLLPGAAKSEQGQDLFLDDILKLSAYKNKQSEEFNNTLRDIFVGSVIRKSFPNLGKIPHYHFMDLTKSLSLKSKDGKKRSHSFMYLTPGKADFTTTATEIMLEFSKDRKDIHLQKQTNLLYGSANSIPSKVRSGTF